MHRIAFILALAVVLGAVAPAARAQDGTDPSGGENQPPEGLTPAGEKPALSPAEREKALRERKDAFFRMFKDRLEDMEKNQDEPEKEEIARLTQLKADYERKLEAARGELERSKEIVRKSFLGLVNSNQSKETMEQRCEAVWLDYLASSRKSKMQIHEYERAIEGVVRRIKYIRHRLATREYPTADKGQKYYLSDPIELYTDESEILPDAMDGPAKSQVSYYALLKDFVLGIMGRGSADMDALARRITKPPLLEMWESWKKRAALAPGGGEGGK